MRLHPTTQNAYPPSRLNISGTARPVCVPLFKQEHAASYKNPVRFSAGTDIYLQGMPINSVRLAQANHLLKPEIIQWIRSLDQDDLSLELPAVARAYQLFGLSRTTGIPPLVAQGGESPRMTSGGLAAILILMLHHLSPAKDLEDALAQIQLSCTYLTVKARRNIAKHPELKMEGDALNIRNLGRFLFDLPPTGMTTGTFDLSGYSIPACKNILHTTIQSKHIVFLAPNGAMQIIQMPTPADWKAIIESDRLLQQQIRMSPPNFITKNKVLTGDPVTDLLGLLDEQTLKSLSGNNGSSPLHDMAMTLPIDYPELIRAGKIKVLLNKPGSDHQDVWDNAGSHWTAQCHKIPDRSNQLFNKLHYQTACAIWRLLNCFFRSIHSQQGEDITHSATKSR